MIPTQRVPAMTQGAQNVRCARCGHITSVPPAGGEQTRTLLLPLSPYYMHALSDTALCGADLSFRVLSDMGACCAGSDMAQLVCSRQSCRVLLLYPRGAQQVQCSMCSMINSANTVRYGFLPAPCSRHLTPSAWQALTVAAEAMCPWTNTLDEILANRCKAFASQIGVSVQPYVFLRSSSLTTRAALMCVQLSCMLQANDIGHLVCACCHMTLMYAHGASCVKCAVCNHVTPVSMSSVLHPPQQPQRCVTAPVTCQAPLCELRAETPQ